MTNLSPYGSPVAWLGGVRGADEALTAGGQAQRTGLGISIVKDHRELQHRMFRDSRTARLDPV